MSAPERFLVVDDDAVFRERLSRALQDRGCQVVTAASLEEVQAAWVAEGFDGAVVDLRLACGSGLEVVRFLKERAAPMPVVVLTGYGSIATALQAVRSGAQDYLTKPVDPDRLLAALRGERGTADRRVDRAGENEAPSLDRVEWEHIQRVLADCGGNVSQAARRLGIDRRSLQRKLAKYPPSR
ncbi:MAG: response regulator [Verrucomicrobiales bacterium]|nr:response regulator [Verrucomicrobiales bacterium]